jgi:hypothetical protein
MNRDAIPLAPGQCVNWWQVLVDLAMHRMTMGAISDATGIPKSTLAGYKNLGVEPKHADGERLIALWRTRMHDPVPVVMCEIRQTDRVRK